MSWWSGSWVPSLPSIDFSLPSGIQRRFISFALKRSLGHFLKPGQLDVQQVDSQIGSGYVQVRDLELNNEAIDSLLSGLPLKLHDGSVGKVTARVPWPNPLTSTIGLSLESLHLTFYVVPEQSTMRTSAPADLAESVASVAESFIHGELSPREEAALRESFHPNMAASGADADNLPGGLDPFITEEEVVQTEIDPPGVSLFATLIERLLARFAFDAVDTKITLVHPQNASFTLAIPEMRYGTETNVTVLVGSEQGEVRTVSISEVAVTTRCLLPASPQVQTPSGSSHISQESSSHPGAFVHTDATPPVSPPSSPHSDSSDMDEDTQMLMSQSIAAFPPRPASLASSVASSLYQSAISGAPSVSEECPNQETGSRSSTPSPGDREVAGHSPHLSRANVDPQALPHIDTRSGEIEDETILSFASEPIAVRLTTPPSPSSSATPQRTSSSTSTMPHSQRRPKGDDKAGSGRAPDDGLRITMSVGLIACAMRARHIRSIIDLADLWSKHSPATTQSRNQNNRESRGSGPVLFDTLEASCRVRGVVLLLLPAPKQTYPDYAGKLAEFFRHPLVPPKLGHGFVRLHLDDMSGSCSMSAGTKTTATQSRGQRRMPHTSSPPAVHMSLTVTLSELSAFAFVATPESGPYGSPYTAKLNASPLLIADPYLSSQYPQSHTHPADSSGDTHYPTLPTFDVVDWTAPALQSTTAKLSLWRTKAPQHTPSHTHSYYHQASGQSPPSMVPQRSPRRKGGELPIPSSPTSVRSAHLAYPGRSPIVPSSSPGRSGELMQRSHGPAMTAKMTWTASSQTDRSRNVDDSVEAEISFQPLHVFVDFGLVLLPNNRHERSEALVFLEGITTSTEDLNPQAANDPHYEEFNEEPDSDFEERGLDTRPGTPRQTAFSLQEVERERERERRRLERLVLEDLDLGFDYSQKIPEKRAGEATSRVQSWRKTQSRVKKARNPTVKVSFPMFRVQIRNPPPSRHSPRSGALVIDVHDLKLSPGGSVNQIGRSSTRFAMAEDPYFAGAYPTERPVRSTDNTLLSVDWGRIIIAYAPVADGKASTLLSLGPCVTDETKREGVQFGAGISPHSQDPELSLRPQMAVIRSPSPTSLTDCPPVSALAITLDIPSVHVELSKPILDGLQLWADDVTQLMGTALSDSAGWDSDTEKAASRDPSLIGSRYFAQRTGSQASGTESGNGSVSGAAHLPSNNETAVKVAVSRAVIRVFLPRQSEGPQAIRNFDVFASDIDMLVELKPEGRDETVLTLGILDITVKEMAKSGATTLILTPSSSFNLASTPRTSLKVRFASLTLPETTSKESRIKVTLCGVTHNVHPDFEWIADLGRFVEAPPGAFESVVPSERTRISVTIVDSAIRALAPSHPGALVMYVEEMDFHTVIVGNSAERSFHLEVPALALFLVDDLSMASEQSDFTKRSRSDMSPPGIAFWKGAGYALLANLANLDLRCVRDDNALPADTRVNVERGQLQLHLCADTMTALTAFIGDLTTVFQSSAEPTTFSPKKRSEPTRLSEVSDTPRGLLSSLDEQAFRQLPEVGAAPDMIQDDLPSNLDYLDESFGAAGGLRELDDDEFDELGFDNPATAVRNSEELGSLTTFGGETIKMLRPEGLQIIQNHFNTMTPDSDGISSYGDTILRVRLHNFDVVLFLYDGYDWVRTRRIIEEEQKEMRRRLAKIRQLVASGQTPDPSVEETNTLLFNSVYIGLEHNVDELEPGALIAAIDEELNEELESTSQSSWQSLKPQLQFTNSPGKSGMHPPRSRRKRMRRSRGPSIEFRLLGLDAEIDRYKPEAELVARTLVTVRDVEILDHIRTSTWSKFLTALREDSRGNVRETDSNMARVELRSVHPVPGHPSEEARLRAKILPLRLHVDQDALDFLKKFFSFKDPESVPEPSADSSDDIYFQQAEVFPVDIKLDYKPRRVDYRALRDGRTIELMNFFHFDGAEMTLRHITLTGITGWPRLFDLLNDLWTPDVKATQLVDVISGVSPIRSVVNVGSGVADLVLLPIAQYKKDGRVVRGLQKGTTAFVKSTAVEAIKLGAKLATGTQVILEQAENVIGGQFKDAVTAEAVQSSPFLEEAGEVESDEDVNDLFSRYAEQPMNVQEGMQSAYKSLKKNFNSAAQTILAVPMEVYERSGNEGPVRAVVRAVPIAVLKPMIGASEAVSKTLLGLHNSLDPNVRHENEAKYKQR